MYWVSLQIFSSKVIVSQFIMHKIIGVILALDNKVQQPYWNVINNVYAIQFLHVEHYQYLETLYPGWYQHELHLKFFFNTLPATGYLGIATFPENAQQRRG